MIGRYAKEGVEFARWRADVTRSSRVKWMQIFQRLTGQGKGKSASTAPPARLAAAAFLSPADGD